MNDRHDERDGRNGAEPARHPRHLLEAADIDRLHQLRRHRAARRQERAQPPGRGARIADRVAATVGSWTFIIVQSALLVLWIGVNALAWFGSWDPYPFILLNLMLSFQAAYTAPIIMMSQNRQADVDRAKAAEDYDINLKAELEIELLHHKVDLLREQEIARLTRLVEELTQELKAARGA